MKTDPLLSSSYFTPSSVFVFFRDKRLCMDHASLCDVWAEMRVPEGEANYQVVCKWLWLWRSPTCAPMGSKKFPVIPIHFFHVCFFTRWSSIGITTQGYCDSVLFYQLDRVAVWQSAYLAIFSQHNQIIAGHHNQRTDYLPNILADHHPSANLDLGANFTLDFVVPSI